MNKQFTVMVVEDEKLLLEAITKKLQLENFFVKGFISGREALEEVKKGSDLPDLIWLDYYLGEINGREFLEMLKPILGDKWIPVMVVSNSASPQKVAEVMDLGVNKYLLKAEHRLEDLIVSAKEILGQK
jgi:CheY-like chemotaxis protein